MIEEIKKIVEEEIRDNIDNIDNCGESAGRFSVARQVLNVLDKYNNQTKQQKELLDKIYQLNEERIIDYEVEHDCCQEEVSLFASEVVSLYPKGEDK